MDPIIAELEREAVERRRKQFIAPPFRPGDTLIVGVRVVEGDRQRTQAFEGVCIARRRGGINENFTVRKISYGVGVERVFPLHSPGIVSIEVRQKGAVRRAKLYYLRNLRGKAARISERTEHSEALRFPDSGLAYATIGPRSAFYKMVTALQQLQELRGAAEGPKVRAAISHALETLPSEPIPGVRRNDIYEQALTIGEHLCPLMFSYDEKVAKGAREGLARLGELVAKRRATGQTDSLVTFLRYLEVEVVFQLSIKHHDHTAEVGLTVKDLLFAAAAKPGLTGHKPIQVQLLLEDINKPTVQTLAETKLGPRGSEKIHESVDGDAKALRTMFITLLADGREVFRFPLARNAERLFVL